MTPTSEKRLLQAAMALTLLVPLSAAIPSVIGGPGFLGRPPVVPVDLDSHFRYLSGLFLGMLLWFASCIPDVETKGQRLRILGAMVVLGGLARLASLLIVGVPSTGHVVGLGIELGVVPLLLAWQARLSKRFA